MNYLAARLIFCPVLFCYCFTGSSEALAAEHFVKYLHVAANEGDSSGGHSAIRFDSETFHFQHDPSGIIRLQRLDSPTFDHVYSVLGNRPILESWIAVSADTYRHLLDGFTQVLLIQDEQLQIFDSLQRDVALFEFLLDRLQPSGISLHPATMPLKGLGYFVVADLQKPAVYADDQKLSAVRNLSRLKSLVNSRYGENFISQRMAHAEAAIHTMKLRAAAARTQSLAADLYPACFDSASAAYTEAQLGLSALQLLQSEPSLVLGSYWSSSSDLFKLAPEESLFLKAFAEKLTNDLLLLVNSSRSDWGFPFIAGMARLAAIEASLDAGCLILLDIFPDTPVEVVQQNFPGRRYLPAMKKEAERQFQRKRQEFFSMEETREADFAVLELLGNKLMEFEHSLADDVQPRQLPETPGPARPALLSVLSVTDMNESELKRELESARRVKKEYARSLASLYEYDLFQRNCVTEIFTYINRILTRTATLNEVAGQSAKVDPSLSASAESLLRLGGYIDPLQGLHFIPAVSSGKVAACYRVTAQKELPSYRSAQLAGMKKRESALLVFLRESNTITSTIYRRAQNDSAFLFFTEETFFLRPVYGAFNLLAGLGECLLGLAVMPVEGPNRLYLGTKGILFSLPELFFINLRKGTMEYVAEAG